LQYPPSCLDCGVANCTWIVTYIEVARVQEGGILVVCVPKVLKCDVIDEPIANIRSGPRLEARSVLSVQHPHVLNVHVANEALLAAILANRAHRSSVSTIAVHSIQVQTSGVGFGGETVVSNIDPGPFDPDVLDVERVEEIRVLG